MPPKDNSERACEECIHYWACSRQCGEPMAQSSATGCECYETVKSSMAYYVGTLDGAKVKIPNRLRELAEADKAGRVLILPCAPDAIYWEKVGGILAQSRFEGLHVYEDGTIKYAGYGIEICSEDIGKTVFLTGEEAEKALQEMEGKKDG